jgi:hypothetical protein
MPICEIRQLVKGAGDIVVVKQTNKQNNYVLVCEIDIVENENRKIPTPDGLPSPTWVGDFLKEEGVAKILSRPKNGSITRANTSRMHASGAGTRTAHFDASMRLFRKAPCLALVSDNHYIHT